MAIGLADHQQVRLDSRLDVESTRAIVSKAVAGARAYPRALTQRVVDRADGVPLFAEELTRLLMRGDAEPQEIPSSLSGPIDRQAGPAGLLVKPLLQIAAVLGQEFPFRLLQSVSGVGERRLRTALDSLRRSDFLVSRSSAADRTYAFRHALIRDAAYAALLRTQRVDLHRKAAATIAERFPEVAGAQPEIVAQHWEAAREPDRALAAWRAAGRLAVQRRAFQEAEAAYERALPILSALPESPDRDVRELDLLSALAGVLQITHGYASREATEATERARLLAERQGDARRQFTHLAGQWMSASGGGDYRLASPLAERLVPVARALGDAASLGVAHMALMTTRHRMGDQLGAKTAFDDGAPYFGSSEFRRLRGAVAQTYGNAGIISWLLGEETSVRGHARQILSFARDRNQPYELAFGQYMAALLAVLLGDFGRAAELARQAVQISDEEGFPQFAGTARVVLGRAAAGAGDPKVGVLMAEDGLTRLEATRNRAGFAMYVAWLGETQALCGIATAARDTFNKALRANPDERYFHPEILRLRAIARTRLGDAAGARGPRDWLGSSQGHGS